MDEIREFTSFYDLFYRYFETGCSMSKTLREYGMIQGRKSNASIAATFSSLKKKYPDEYNNAKDDYLASLGINTTTLITLAYALCSNACRDSDKIAAIRLTNDLLNGVGDSRAVLGINKLDINIVDPKWEDDYVVEGESDG